MIHRVALLLLAVSLGFAKPQDPIPPYPYHEEEITFQSSGFTLSGTLTYPKDAVARIGVVLITGSGPQNRDEEILGHKPFLILADFLTRQGFAVLRYDDRGVGKSGGNFVQATTKDFCDDAISALNELRAHKLKLKKVGMIGHSEGGAIALMAAARKKGPDFVVGLAASALPMAHILRDQRQTAYRHLKLPETQIDFLESFHTKLVGVASQGGDDREISRIAMQMARQAIPVTGLGKEDRKARALALRNNYLAVARTYQSPWFRFILAYDPKKDLQRVNVPVLALNGSLDRQVEAESNLKAIRDSIPASNKNVSTKVLPGLNHLFQAAKTGMVDEYALIEESFNVSALTNIGDWLEQL